MTPRLRCQGCGLEIEGDVPAPYRCPNAGSDDGDHVLAHALAPASVGTFPRDGDPDPFVRYRALTHAHALALSRGMSDDAFVEVVREVDARVAATSGRGFRVTPFAPSASLSGALGFEAPGEVWIKDETENVSGSHKGRHLVGLALLDEVQARTGIARPRARLAIASCGNAALAGAVLARALGRPIDVFIPEDANPHVVSELARLGAAIHVCPRVAGVAGDPCYRAFREAVSGGALPFCCQGPDHGLTVEGGETLAWEIVSELARQGRTLDRLFVQVGGGALASACVQGFQDAERRGERPLPRLHAVQTSAAFPLRRAWERVASRAAARLGIEPNAGDAWIADRLSTHRDSPEVQGELAYAARHRSEFMWPWEATPHSVAHGILDDETYDWLAVVRGMIESGGFPVVVSEGRLVEANAVGRDRTGIDVDPTGSAGLAGLLELRARGEVGPHESVAVLFTGVARSPRR